MSDFMQLFIYEKAPLYSANCDNCGATIFAHPHTGTFEAELRAGKAPCSECTIGHASPETVSYEGRQYAGRYSAPGYLDCTDWYYGTDADALEAELRELYGDDEDEEEEEEEKEEDY